MEVDEQTNSLVRETKVRKQLRVMNWRQLIDKLNLNYYRVFHNQVQTVPAIKLHVPINDRQRPLFFNL